MNDTTKDTAGKDGQTYELTVAQDVPHYGSVTFTSPDDATALARARLIEAGSTEDCAYPALEAEWNGAFGDRIVSLVNDTTGETVAEGIETGTPPSDPRHAVMLLREARDTLIRAGASRRTVDRVRASLRSAEGAVRHHANRAEG